MILLIIGTIYLYSLYVLDSSIAWISFFGSLFLYGLHLFSISPKYKWVTKIFVVVVFTIVGVILLPRFLHKESFSLKQKILEIKDAKKMITVEQKNIFFGRGQYASGFFFSKYKSPQWNNTAEWFWKTSKVRGQFFEALFTTGVVNLLIFLIPLIWAIKKSIKSRPFTVIILLYSLIFQLFYYLIPIFYILSLFYLTESIKGRKKYYLNKRLFAFFAIGISVFIFYFAIRYLAAEYFYSTRDFAKAVQYNIANTEYIRAAVNEEFKKIEECKQAGCSPNIFYDLALQQAKDALRINSYEPENWNMYSTILFRKSLDNPGLKKSLQKLSYVASIKAYDLDPTNPEYSDGLGLIFLDQKNYRLAERYFQNAAKLKKDYIPSYKHLKELYKQTNNQEKLGKIDYILKQYNY